MKKQKHYLSYLYALILFASVPFIHSCNDSMNVEPNKSIISEASQIAPPISGAIDIVPGINSWVVNDQTYAHDIVSSSGIHGWTDQSVILRAYFWLNGTGNIDLEFNGKAPTGASTLTLEIDGQIKQVVLNNSSYENIYVGNYNITNPGYKYVEIKCTQKTSTYVADINNLYVSGSATSNGVDFIDSSNPHFGRRGPSVHLSYNMPTGKNLRWFYNEITVPTGNDIIGSYYMANGFGQGYFGMQVNSATERRILFSVWSPWSTDNPGEIPDDYKVILLDKGEGVITNDFGGEGSGGQSYKIFNWEAGKTYKFLLGGHPSVNNSTDYEAYFYDPETDEWSLIAKWRRPHTNTHLTNFYSFLENFSTGTGHLTRQVQFDNQWVYATDGNWYESTGATYSYDATATARDRLDYQGGLSGGKYYLKNCGFFSDNTPTGTTFSRAALGNAPTVNLNDPTSTPPNGDKQFLDKSGWSVFSFSSEATSGEGSNGLVDLIIDGNNSSYWHSCWSGCNQTYSYPHTIVIDMGSNNTADGFSFVQRNGSRKIKDFSIEIWKNGTWLSLGSFVLADHADEQFIDLNQQASDFRYFRITAISAHDGQSFAALAEVGAYTN